MIGKFIIIFLNITDITESTIKLNRYGDMIGWWKEMKMEMIWLWNWNCYWTGGGKARESSSFLEWHKWKNKQTVLKDTPSAIGKTHLEWKTTIKWLINFPNFHNCTVLHNTLHNMPDPAHLLLSLCFLSISSISHNSCRCIYKRKTLKPIMFYLKQHTEAH